MANHKATLAAPRGQADPVWRMISGAAVFAAGVYICGAIGSYSATDPSWNAATGAEPTNLFGQTGAIFADLALQLFGWAAWFGGLLAFLGGARRACLEGTPKPRRWALGLLTLPLSSAALAAWPIPDSWPIGASVGGVVGDVLLSAAALPFAALLLPEPQLWAAVICSVLACLTIAATAGFDWDDARALGQTLFGGLWKAAAALVGAVVAVAASRPDLKLFHAIADRVSGEKNPYAEDNIIRTGGPQDQDPDLDYYEPEEEDAPETMPADNSSPAPASEDVPVSPKATPAPGPKRTKNGGAPAGKTAPRPKLAQAADVALPPLDLLTPGPARRSAVDEADLLTRAERLGTVLMEFGVKGRITEVRPGPVVTLFEFEPAAGVKSSRVIALADDIARSMSALSARVAVIPGKNAIGVELPNETRETVHFHSLLKSKAFQKGKPSLPLALGEDIGGQPSVVDLAKMPHLLIAGTTGSGKSVGINAMILSLMFKLSPEQCRFIMIDPKMLELSIYEGIPHLLAPVVIDPQKAVTALKWTVREMESRYELMSKAGVRNLAGFNAKVKELRETGGRLTREVQTGYDQDTGRPIFEIEDIKLEEMPNIVVVIDEMADLMMVAGKEIEGCIQRLAQMARAAGIHLITATQRPSVDVITGTIKANFPTRISYMVTSKIDSRTILGEQGAEQLLGMGDLLYMAPGGKVQRLHGPFVSDEDVATVVEYLKSTGEPDYRADITEEPDEVEDSPVMDALLGTSSGNEEEDLYAQAVAVVMKDGRASTSYIQRRLKIGYNRAASLIERMEDEGVISGPNHAGKREVLRKSASPTEDAA